MRKRPTKPAPDTAGSKHRPTGRRTSIGARRNPESEQAILDAAAAILREQGATGFSIEAVARRAGAGKPTIYRWWPSKAALLLQVYGRLKLELPRHETGSLTTDIKAMLTTIFRFWRETAAGQVFRSIVAQAQSDPDALQSLRSYTAERIAEIELIFERARARGELDAGAQPRILAELVSGYLWERLLLDRVPTDANEMTQVAGHIAQRYAGVGANADAAPPGPKARSARNVN